MARLRQTADRLALRARAVDPDRRDVLFAVVAAVAMLTETFAQSGSHSASAIVATAVECTCIAAALRWRRTSILPAVIVGIAIGVNPITHGYVGSSSLTPFIVVIAILYSLAYHQRGRRLVIGCALYAIGVAGGVIGDSSDSLAGDLLFAGSFAFALPLFGALSIRRRAELNAELRLRAAQLEEQRRERERAAVLTERTRIAGELHDVVAHNVSVMVIQAAAARRLAGQRPADARPAIEAIEATGREALGEMRRLLGVLRRGDEDLALAPQPSLRRVADLAARSGAAGLPVAVRVEGAAIDLPPGLDVAAYRVIQEALSGLLAGADGDSPPAEVVVRYGPRELELHVLHVGDVVPNMRGARERVRLFGGELRAGQRRGGGIDVRVVLPLTAEAA